MAANLVNEDLWEKVILQAGPGEIPALNREMAAALRRDTLYKAFAARRAPRLWGALGAAPPGRDRFRRAVLLHDVVRTRFGHRKRPGHSDQMEF